MQSLAGSEGCVSPDACVGSEGSVLTSVLSAVRPRVVCAVLVHRGMCSCGLWGVCVCVSVSEGCVCFD